MTHRHIIRKGGLENLHLQRFGHWGRQSSARRFRTPQGAEEFAKKIGLSDYGIFPAGSRRPVKWGRDMQMEAHKMGWDIFINDDGKFYLQALDDPHGVAAEAAEFHGLEPDAPESNYTGPNFEGYKRDFKAMNYVVKQANGGNLVCRRAIEFLLDRLSPDARYRRLDLELTWLPCPS